MRQARDALANCSYGPVNNDVHHVVFDCNEISLPTLPPHLKLRFQGLRPTTLLPLESHIAANQGVRPR
jgi:hypothetical protein